MDMKPTPHRSPRHAFLVFLLFILPLLAAPPGTTNAVQQQNVASVQAAPNDSGALRFSVTVLGPKGGFITGLTKGDFSVWEGKTEREINYFRSDELPASVGILIDVSGSVLPKTLAAAKYAVARFAEQSHPKNEYFVVEFNQERRKLIGWTRDMQEMLKSLDKLALPPQDAPPQPTPRGQTAFYDACAAALEEVARRPNPKHVLLLITDGQDNQSRLTLDQLRRKVKASDVQLYGLSVTDPNHRFDYSSSSGQTILDELITESGGWVYFPGNKKELDESVDRIAVELRHQYVIGFTPTNAARGGKWNKVKIKVTPSSVVSLKDLKVRSREGYFSPTTTPAP
jgi:Ca-activated chloride channel family protein